MRHSGGGAGWAALARPAMGLAMSASLGVGGGALLGAALATSVPGVLRPRVAESAILRCTVVKLRRLSLPEKQQPPMLHGVSRRFSGTCWRGLGRLFRAMGRAAADAPGAEQSGSSLVAGHFGCRPRSGGPCAAPCVGSLLTLRPLTTCRGKSAAMFLAAAGVYWAAVVLDAEPLLACVTAGLVVANRRWIRSSSDQLQTDVLRHATHLSDASDADKAGRPRARAAVRPDMLQREVLGLYAPASPGLPRQGATDALLPRAQVGGRQPRCAGGAGRRAGGRHASGQPRILWHSWRLSPSGESSEVKVPYLIAVGMSPTWQRMNFQEVLSGLHAGCCFQSADSVKQCQRDIMASRLKQVIIGGSSNTIGDTCGLTAALPAGGAVGGGAAGRGAGRRGVGGVCPGRPAGPRGAGRRAPPVAGHDHAGARVMHQQTWDWFRFQGPQAVRHTIAAVLDDRTCWSPMSTARHSGCKACARAQAGIAMGLAKAVAARFPSWGQDFSTLMVCYYRSVLQANFELHPDRSRAVCMEPAVWQPHWQATNLPSPLQIGVILFNMLSGPSLFRAAIVALGENRRRGFQDADSRTLTK